MTKPSTIIFLPHSERIKYLEWKSTDQGCSEIFQRPKLTTTIQLTFVTASLSSFYRAFYNQHTNLCSNTRSLTYTCVDSSLFIFSRASDYKESEPLLQAWKKALTSRRQPDFAAPRNQCLTDDCYQQTQVDSASNTPLNSNNLRKKIFGDLQEKHQKCYYPQICHISSICHQAIKLCCGSMNFTYVS